MDRPQASDPLRSVTAFDPETIPRSATLTEAAAKMRDLNCSALLAERRAGGPAVITERDIVEAVADGGASDWVTDVMTREVIIVDADMTIADAAQYMLDAGIRHLVVDAEGRLGIVSVRDLLEPLIESSD